jgi:small subunit ribosomal protein S18
MPEAEKLKQTVEEKEKKEDSKLSDVFDDSEITEERRHRRTKRVQVDLKCPFCESGLERVTYKDVYQLKKYTSVRGKIIGRDKSGMCARHQRQLSSAIKKARYMALLPYVSLTK